MTEQDKNWKDTLAQKIDVPKSVWKQVRPNLMAIVGAMLFVVWIGVEHSDVIITKVFEAFASESDVASGVQATREAQKWQSMEKLLVALSVITLLMMTVTSLAGLATMLVKEQGDPPPGVPVEAYNRLADLHERTLELMEKKE